MKDIVVGFITGYDFDKIKPWVNSLDRSGFTGTKAMICYDVDFDTVNELTTRGYTVFAFKKDQEKRRFVYKQSPPKKNRRELILSNFEKLCLQAILT